MSDHATHEPQVDERWGTNHGKMASVASFDPRARILPSGHATYVGTDRGDERRKAHPKSVREGEMGKGSGSSKTMIQIRFFSLGSGHFSTEQSARISKCCEADRSYTHGT